MRMPRLWPLLIGLLASAGVPAAQADGLDVEASASVPRVARTSAGAPSWRYVSLRAQTVDFDAAFSVADCVRQPDATAVSGTAGGLMAATDARCGIGGPGGREGLPGNRWSVTWKVPEFSREAPLVDVTVNGRMGGTAARLDTRNARGTAAELSLTQPVGPLDIVVGYAVPLQRRGSADAQTLFTSLNLRQGAGRSLELYAEFDRQAGGQLRDSVVGARTFVALREASRLVAFLSHTPGAEARWQAGVGLEVRF